MQATINAVFPPNPGWSTGDPDSSSLITSSLLPLAAKAWRESVLLSLRKPRIPLRLSEVEAAAEEEHEEEA